MSLAELWTNSREQLDNKHVHQIIAFAGTGQLSDGGPGAIEFRELLGIVPSEHLARYSEECLLASFPGSGFRCRTSSIRSGEGLATPSSMVDIEEPRTRLALMVSGSFQTDTRLL
jgi:hypothetical protein